MLSLPGLTLQLTLECEISLHFVRIKEPTFLRMISFLGVEALSKEGMKCFKMIAGYGGSITGINEDELRGRKPIFREKEWEILEDFINSEGFEGTVCGYEEIMTEALPYLYQEHPNLHLQTIRTAFEDRGYHKCVACQKLWLSKQRLIDKRQYLDLREDLTKEQ
jgi:hypothetical protein